MKFKNKYLLILLFLVLGIPRLSLARMSLGSVSDKPVREASGDEYFGSIMNYGFGFQCATFRPSSQNIFSSGSGILANFLMEYRSKYGIEISYGSIDLDAKESPELGSGTVKIKPFTISILYSFSPESNLSAYLLGGLGLYGIQESLLSPATNEWISYGYGYKASIDDAMGYHAGLGLKFFPNRNRRIALNLDYRYLSLKPEYKYDVTLFGNYLGYGKSEIDLGGQILRLGASLYF